MPLLSKPPTLAQTALFYITGGALTVVWAVIWYVYLFNNPPEPDSKVYYWCTGFLVSGLTLLGIGLGLGKIGRSARSAELPLPEVPPPVATIVQDPAGPPAAVASTQPATPVAVPKGKVPPATTSRAASVSVVK